MGKFWNIIRIVQVVVEMILDVKARKDSEPPPPPAA